MSKTTKVTISRDQLIKLLETHVQKNNEAFFVPKGSHLAVVEWVGRSDVGCDVNLVFESEKRPV